MTVSRMLRMDWLPRHRHLLLCLMSSVLFFMIRLIGDGQSCNLFLLLGLYLNKCEVCYMASNPLHDPSF
jgi:hypothetical protein